MHGTPSLATGPPRGRERRRSLLFDATDFTELTARDHLTARDRLPQHPVAFSPKSLGGNSLTIAFKRAASIGTVLNAFSKLPPKESWLRSGIVERQTVSSDMVWLPRLMVLTDESLFFAKEGSDIILDRLSLQNVTFIGKVINS